MMWESSNIVGVFVKSETMATCAFCESGTFDFVEMHYMKTGHVIYCRNCWIEMSGGKPNATRQN